MSGPYNPSLEEVERLADQGNMVPVYREVSADLETPVSAYIKVARPPYSFLLESVEGGEQIARYSFIGTEPLGVVRTGAGQTNGMVDPLIPIQRTMNAYKLVPIPDLGPFNGGMVGYISYDAVKYFERLPTPENDPVDVPESVFMMTTTFLIFDHVRHVIRVVSHAFLDGDVETAYMEAIERIDEIVERLDGPLHAPPRSSNGTTGLHGDLELHARPVRPHRRTVQGVHLRRGYHSDRPLTAVLAVHDSAPAGDLPGAAGDQPFSVHVLPRTGRFSHRRRVAGRVGPCAGRRGVHPPHRGNHAARQDEGRGRRDRAAPAGRREGAGRAHHAGRPRTQTTWAAYASPAASRLRS